MHLDEWGQGETYFQDIVGDLNHWSVGYTDWNLILDQTGGPTHVGESCDSAVIARFDLEPVTLHYQPMYYAMGHFSRFLPRDSQRVANSISTASKLQYTTFIRGTEDNEEIVMMLMNNQDVTDTLYIQAGKLFANVTAPAHSMYSLVFPANLLLETIAESSPTVALS